MKSCHSQKAALVLEQKAAEILHQWEERVRSSVPAAKKQGRTALRDGFPVFLEELAHALAGCGEEALLAPETSLEHAEQRASLTDYSYEQILHEYQLMRDTILDVLWAVEPLQLDEIQMILRMTDTAVSEALGHYRKIQAR